MERSSDIGDALTRLTEFATPETRRKIVVWASRRYDLECQIVTEYRIFEELNPDGVVVKKTYTALVLRWVYRYDLEHLLELCGFEAEALYGNFMRGSYTPGAEQVWMARKVGCIRGISRFRKFRVPLCLNRLDRTLSRLYLGRLLSSLHSWSGGGVMSGMGSECVH